MLEQLRYLVQLQKLEDKKNLLIRSRDETPKRIEAVKKEYEKFEAEFLIKKGELDHAKKMHKSLEQEVSDLEAKVRRSQQRMHEVKTNKEYQAMLKEIEDRKEEITLKEDQMLELMETIEALSEEVKGLEKELEKRRKKMEKEVDSLASESDKVSEQLVHIQNLQERVRRKLENDLVKRCDSLFERRGGVAVAAVESGVCQVCHMNIPPQKFIELQRDENIFTCPHCHRFIYWPGHESYTLFDEDLEEV